MKKILLVVALVVAGTIVAAVMAALAAKDKFQPFAEKVLVDCQAGRETEVYQAASASFRGEVPLDEFRAYLDVRRRVLGGFRRVTKATGGGISASTKTGTIGSVQLALEYEKGPAAGEFQFQKEGEDWKLRHLKITYDPKLIPPPDRTTLEPLSRELIALYDAESFVALYARFSKPLQAVWKPDAYEPQIRAVFARAGRTRSVTLRGITGASAEKVEVEFDVTYVNGQGDAKFEWVVGGCRVGPHGVQHESRPALTRATPNRGDGPRGLRSREGVEDLLDVVVLLERVDHLEHLPRLVFGQVDGAQAHVLRPGRHGVDPALLERALHAPEVGEAASRDQLRLALVVGALDHLVEAVVDQVELERVGVEPRRREAEHAHPPEVEGDAAHAAQVPAVRLEVPADVRDRARRIVGRGLDEDGDAVRREPLVLDLLVVDGVLAGRAPDRRLDLVLRHVEGARVLHGAAQRGVAVGVAAAPLHRDRDLLGDARELLRHPVPPGEHRVLALLEDAAHGGFRGTSAGSSPGTVSRTPGADEFPSTRAAPIDLSLAGASARACAKVCRRRDLR